MSKVKPLTRNLAVLLRNYAYNELAKIKPKRRGRARAIALKFQAT